MLPFQFERHRGPRRQMRCNHEPCVRLNSEKMSPLRSTRQIGTPCDEPHKRYLVYATPVQLVISTGVENTACGDAAGWTALPVWENGRAFRENASQISYCFRQWLAIMKGERCLHPFDSAQGKTFGRHDKRATPCDEPHK